MAVADYVAQATLLDDFNRSNTGPPPSASWNSGSLTTATIGEVQSNPATLEVMLAVMGEAVAVATAHGVEGLGFELQRVGADDFGFEFRAR